MKRLLWIAIILIGNTAIAAPIETWSGAGPHACMGKCPQLWAETQLTADELSELEEAQRESPEPYFIPIENGDVFTMATYFKDGEPVAYRTTTVAMLSEPTTSEGWHMDGWSFVKLDDCQNWTIVQHTNINGQNDFVNRSNHSRLYSSTPPIQTPIPWPLDDPHDPWPPIVWNSLILDKPPIELVVTPLPAGFYLLTSTFGGLVLLKRRKS